MYDFLHPGRHRFLPFTGMLQASSLARLQRLILVLRGKGAVAFLAASFRTVTASRRKPVGE